MHEDHQQSSIRTDKLAQRISYILGQLYQGMDLDRHALATMFGVSVRTIERDLARLGSVAGRGPDGS